MDTVAVELFFMMFVLKLPVVYLCAVVWWAVRAEPRPFEGAARPVEESPLAPPSCPWRRRPRPSPRGGPSARVAVARRARVRA